MWLERTEIGVSTGHSGQRPRPVEELRLSSGVLTIAVWTYGATLVELHVPDRAGRMANVVVRLPDLAAYERREGRAYLGATMGRYARCVSGAQVMLDGRTIALTPNVGAHHLHGGQYGFDSFVWDVVGAECSSRGAEVRLRLQRPDGDEGYSGDITVETTYAIAAPDTLILEHVAAVMAPTICDITNHAMWNLSGDGPLDRHWLAVNAARVLVVDDDLMPTGDPVPVEDTRFDLRLARPLAGVRLDNCFVLHDRRWAATLADPTTGRCMMIATDQPGLQIYTGDAFARPRAGVCLQAGSWPNAPVRPDFPSARLDPGVTYHSHTTHRFRTMDHSDVAHR